MANGRSTVQRMLRILTTLLFTLVAALAIPPLAAADLDDFTFDSFHAEYTLSRDAEHRSELHTRETIVARFPDYDQNRGIRRDIPAYYQNRSTHLAVLSVTDETGRPRSFTSEYSGEFLSLTIAVPEGQYVHGEQTYVVEYTQRDVTHFFADTNSDEFYWDVNGTGWRQPFGEVSAVVWLEPELATALTGDAACYFGAEGSTTRCELQRGESGGDAVLAAAARDLAPYENLTLALGFTPGTFVEPELSGVERNAGWISSAPLVGAVVALLTALIGRFTVWRNAPRERPVAASPVPPAGVDIYLAANLTAQRERAATATMLDFAVRGNATVLEYVPPRDPSAIPPWPLRRRKSGRPGAVYGIRADSTAGLSEAERRFGDVLFPPAMSAGETRWFSARSEPGITAALVQVTKATAARAVAEGYRRRAGGGATRALVGVLIAIVVVTVIAAVVIATSPGRMLLGLVIGCGVAAATVTGLAIAFTATRRPLTPRGRAAADQLLAVKRYVRLPEGERAVIDQSALAAARELLYAAPYYSASPGPIAFSVEVVRLHERLLPYAALFGRQQQWLEELELESRGEHPRWFQSNSDASSLGFATGVSSFSSSAAQTVTPASSSSSSSSGGSSGGGSSGGGGGGGGGGGV